MKLIFYILNLANFIKAADILNATLTQGLRLTKIQFYLCRDTCAEFYTWHLGDTYHNKFTRKTRVYNLAHVSPHWLNKNGNQYFTPFKAKPLKLATKICANAGNFSLTNVMGTVESEHPYQSNEFCYYEIAPSVEVKSIRIRFKKFDIEDEAEFEKNYSFSKFLFKN